MTKQRLMLNYYPTCNIVSDVSTDL